MMPDELTVRTDDNVDNDVNDHHEASTYSQKINSISNPFNEFLFIFVNWSGLIARGNNKSII